MKLEAPLRRHTLHQLDPLDLDPGLDILQNSLPQSMRPHDLFILPHVDSLEAYEDEADTGNGLMMKEISNLYSRTASSRAGFMRRL
nr:hypothetical protein CFP56_67369 [Quercus suber]